LAVLLGLKLRQHPLHVQFLGNELEPSQLYDFLNLIGLHPPVFDGMLAVLAFSAEGLSVRVVLLAGRLLLVQLVGQLRLVSDVLQRCLAVRLVVELGVAVCFGTHCRVLVVQVLMAVAVLVLPVLSVLLLRVLLRLPTLNQALQVSIFSHEVGYVVALLLVARGLLV
jgi:hypothetical protein